jgi:type IV pilus assembly protein PilB
LDGFHEWLTALRERVGGGPGGDALAEAVPPWSLEEESVARSLAEAHGVPFVSATDLLRELDVRASDEVQHAYRTKHRVAPIRIDDGRGRVASDGPPASQRRLARMLGVDEIEWCITTASGLQRLLVAIDVGEVTHDRAIEARLHETGDDLLDHDLARQTEGVGVLESILIEGAAERASDIHLEHEPGRVRVRMRVDGSLRELGHYDLTASQIAPIVRIAKVRAGIDISEHRRPCGGQFEMKVGGRRYFIRVQSQPTVLGENLVMRLLPQDPALEQIEQLGFSQDVARSYRRLLENPGGMLLVVGPTGSGKTTTLYAGLRVLAADGERKVITIEDPVEIICPGSQQVQVCEEADFGFADAMRSFVREDPDVILLGEIRDEESALEAIRASQTGHLVLTSLHSNDAIDAVQRLRDLGMSSNSIATELTAVFAQRLARRICDHCREPAAPDPRIVREVFPDGAPDGFRAWRGRGCPHCRSTGSYGRIAIVECLTATPDLRRAIARGDLADDLRLLAAEMGLVTLRDRALALAAEGVIAFDGLPRVLPLERLAPGPART